MTTINTPQDAVRTITARPNLPAGTDDRVRGFGIMGLPFDTGHYLAYRDFPASSFSPAYRSVWHCDPDGTVDLLCHHARRAELFPLFQFGDNGSRGAVRHHRVVE